MDDRSATELIANLQAEIGDKLLKYAFWSLQDWDEAQSVDADVWLAAWEALVAGKEPQRWDPWLWKVCRNKICDARKNKKRRRGRREDPTGILTLNLELPQQRDPHDAYATIEARYLVVSLCKKARDSKAISESDLTAVLMKAWGFSDQDIAEVLGLHPSSIKGKRRDALAKIREQLSPKKNVGRTRAEIDSIEAQRKGTVP